MNDTIIPVTDFRQEESGLTTQQVLIDGCHVKLVYPAATADPTSLDRIQSILLGQQHVPAG